MRTLPAIITTLAALLSACVTPGGTTVSVITPEVKNAIALCNAGIESETGLKIEAAIIKNGGKITGGLNDVLKGIFLNRPGFTSSDAVKAQENYIGCLDKYTSATKLSSVEACQAKLACEIDTLQMLCNCRTTIDEIGMEQKLSATFIAKKKGELCYSGQYSLAKCWNGADPTAPRAACTTTVQNAGRILPVPAAGTCLAKKT